MNIRFHIYYDLYQNSWLASSEVVNIATGLQCYSYLMATFVESVPPVVQTVNEIR